MKKREYSNYRVEVIPVIDRWLWPASVSTEDAERKNIIKSLDNLATAIKRHVDAESVSALFDTEEVCSHCGSPWTEARSDYNGGCCGKDEGAEEARLAHAEEVAATQTLG